MTKRVTAAAIPPLRLSPGDERELRTLSEQLQREALAQYEAFLGSDRGVVNPKRWKYARSDGDLHAYKERRTVEGPFKPTKPSDPRLPHQHLASESPLPRVLVVGTIPGTLDDVMFGSAVHDSASVHGYWTSQSERFEESAVLATLDHATVDDPFRFLGVTWFLRSFPLHVRHDRDLLTLTSTSTAQLSNGERVGVDISHSIQHRALADLHEFHTIRAVSSILKVYRQLDDHRVEVFMTHFLDTKGIVPGYCHVQDAIWYLLLTAPALCRAGFRRKLQWLKRRRSLDHLRVSPCDVIEPQSSGASDGCELCSKPLGTLLTSAGTSCELCYQRVCGRCSVSHELTEPVGGKVTRRVADFCLRCLLEARAVPTLAVAQDEVLWRNKSRIHRRHTASSSGSTMYSSESVPKTCRERELTAIMGTEATHEWPW